MSTDSSALIGIDWGLTRLRAFRIGANGQILERRASDRGIAAMTDGGFEAVLADIIDGWPAGLPIVMCGMIGSRQGWCEVPYRPCPAGAGDLAGTFCRVEFRRGPAWIIGGLSTTDQQTETGERSARPRYDVMRGEETQIVGAASAAGDTLIVTPGTHSKWTVVQAGIIRRFRTSMTGEVFAVLQKHSILGSLIRQGIVNRYDEASFLDGVHLGFEEPALLHSLFSVRTQGLFEQQPAAALSHYLSGILIGSEVAAEARRHALDCAAIIVGSADLSHLYELAMAARGFANVRRVDGEDAVAQGLWKLWQLRAPSV